ncbi:hypothetical protein D3C75_1086870 [compost metagenome]
MLVTAAIMQRHQIIDKSGAQFRGGKNGDVAILKARNDVTHQAIRWDHGIVVAFDNGARSQDIFWIANLIIDITHGNSPD